ncbi:MAG: dihydroorotate dehydrogenase [Alistipes sp.]|nr:dihydroorotate dehydrogenase [Candidatus Alistipes equi]
MVKKMDIELCGVHLSNPVVPASGTFGFGTELADAYDLNILGAISLKGTTKEARYGNPTPRIAECENGMINAVGLQNPGIDVLIEKKIPELRKIYHNPIIANLSGFSIEEYTFNAALADKCCDIDIIEINISCPNVRHGGMAFGTDATMAKQVTEQVRKVVSNKPLFIKLSPNVTDIVAIAKACEQAGADGLTLVNTFLGMRIDIQRRCPVIKNRYGGFSGKAIFPIALRMVNQVAKACSIPIMGCGGVSSAEDVIEMMMAGATAVQVGAENIRNPYACKEIIEKLPIVMEKLKIDNLRDIISIV